MKQYHHGKSFQIKLCILSFFKKTCQTSVEKFKKRYQSNHILGIYLIQMLKVFESPAFDHLNELHHI